ncbi:MAG: cation diffusion facilitator family transporter [Chthoniobacterales bacterium]|nr:cation diffusion facilitator family transporter [Chthoniobacterales bacterium]
MDTNFSTSCGANVAERAMSFSLLAGTFQILLKVSAYILTGSAAIFADAAESLVHFLAVIFAYVSLKISRKPPDRDHPYGHAKIGFFSSIFEGAMILVAAIFILGDAAKKILEHPEIEFVGWGIFLTLMSILMNGGLGVWLVQLGRKHRQIILSSNGWHLLTDSWTSIGVIVGLILVWFTKWAYWDPICAAIVAINILVTGTSLVRRGISGLMDEADSKDIAIAEDLLERELAGTGVRYHDLRMRNTGNRVSIDLHLLFDDRMSVRDAHEFATVLERKLSEAFQPAATVMTHIEPWSDQDQLHGNESEFAKSSHSS